jgi:DNA-binding transcriptional LysR family regulator
VSSRRRTAARCSKRGIAIFDELRLGVAEIEYLSDPTVGEVRISASEPIAAGLLPHLIDRFSRRYPQVSIYVTQAPIASLQFLTPQHRDLRERNVDLYWGRSSSHLPRRIWSPSPYSKNHP